MLLTERGLDGRDSLLEKGAKKTFLPMGGIEEETVQLRLYSNKKTDGSKSGSRSALNNVSSHNVSWIPLGPPQKNGRIKEWIRLDSLVVPAPSEQKDSSPKNGFSGKQFLPNKCYKAASPYS